MCVNKGVKILLKVKCYVWEIGNAAKGFFRLGQKTYVIMLPSKFASLLFRHERIRQKSFLRYFVATT